MAGLFAGILEGLFNVMLEFAFAFWNDNLKTTENVVDSKGGMVHAADDEATPQG